MSLQLVQSYLFGLVGLVVAAGIGFAITRLARRIGRWDANITLPLLMGAAGAHLVLISVVELERQLLFGL